MFILSLIFLNVKSTYESFFQIVLLYPDTEMQMLWLEVSANYPLDDLFFFCDYIGLEPLFSGGSLPTGFPLTLGCASVLTRHHRDPTGFSFWLVFMLISHMGVPVPCDYWELRTQTCHIGSGCQFLKNNSLYTHGQSGHQAFFIHFQDGWGSFLILLHGSTDSS